MESGFPSWIKTFNLEGNGAARIIYDKNKVIALVIGDKRYENPVPRDDQLLFFKDIKPGVYKEHAELYYNPVAKSVTVVFRINTEPANFEDWEVILMDMAYQSVH